MNGNKGLIDSNVIIDATKGKISIEEILKEYDFLYVSIISYVEVLGFKFESESEKSAIHELFREIEIVNLEKGIADIAIEIRSLSKIKLPDALILATAKYMEADLITSDIDDFSKIDIKVKLIKPILK